MFKLIINKKCFWLTPLSEPIHPGRTVSSNAFYYTLALLKYMILFYTHIHCRLYASHLAAIIFYIHAQEEHECGRGSLSNTWLKKL